MKYTDHMQAVYDFALDNWIWAQDYELDTEYDLESAKTDLEAFAEQECEDLPEGTTPEEYLEAVLKAIDHVKQFRK